ncbi:hypothetical protein BRYFOR_07567 [Marvinbryantia formatexigens DSM 14469]|uniref:Uncharacterized protein n=1 Tax=Marvinbryantia formatexigens DSM 14469 TaxID=478749 RepID=C6LG07_9FIRM|nr:hypothetical protein [Marvinbryantia formatexigens]EET60371.1 hypothetical protein BRYFOR_07567 [Marvinbryantia formatexigens DSM 14469]UWO25289.1 hypothetical protein NQ534_01995 [Marvinbryantia formatexigens DSM 14469]SDH02730.1 hypothetical protein SAMN05660368_03698 [Marvinbryantia formatexigens]
MPDKSSAPSPQDIKRFFELFPQLSVEMQELLIDLAEKALSNTLSTEEVMEELRKFED